MLRELGTTHEPTVPPGGPGLFHMKGKQLPGAMQHVFNDLVEKGHPHDGRTYALAIGIVENWAHGKGAKDPKVIAKAQAAVAEWEKLKAEAHARSAAKKGGGKLKEGDEFILGLSRLANPFLEEAWSDAARAAAAEAMLESNPSLSEAWSEAARLAAAAARRGNHRAPFQGKNAHALNEAHVAKLNQHAPANTHFGHTQNLSGTHVITVGRVPFAGSFGEHFTAPRVKDPLMASLEEKAQARMRKGTWTNKFRGVDKKTRTHADLMAEVAAKGHAGCGDG